jgi:hypothetical protein
MDQIHCSMARLLVCSLLASKQAVLVKQALQVIMVIILIRL